MNGRQRRVFTDEFKREAVGLIASSSRTIRQVADDMGLGLSTLTRWKREQRSVEVSAAPNPDLTKELARLRKENELLKQERDLLKKSSGLLRQRDKSPLDVVNTVCRAGDEVPGHRSEQGHHVY